MEPGALIVMGMLPIGVRASTWSRDFIVGAGAPDGVSDPCANTDEAAPHNTILQIAANTATVFFFITSPLF